MAIARISGGGERFVDEPDCPEFDRLGRWPAHCKRYLIHDRDPLFTQEFLCTLTDPSVQSVQVATQKSEFERACGEIVRTIKESCLERLILFGERSLPTAIQTFVAHYHKERNHQGLSNRLIQPEREHLGNTGAIQRRTRLGGMLNTTIEPRPEDCTAWLCGSANDLHVKRFKEIGMFLANPQLLLPCRSTPELLRGSCVALSGSRPGIRANGGRILFWSACCGFRALRR